MRLYYDPATGLVQRWVFTPDDDAGIWIDADVADPFGVYVWQGAVHPLPPKPGESATFDPATGAWGRDAAALAADLAAAKASAISLVNAWAGRERARYVTIAPAQEMIYLAKEVEAARWLADPSPDVADYPLIDAEVGITAPDAYQIAQIWAHMAALWRQVAAQIETARLGTIAQIEAAQTEAAVAEINIPT